MMKKNQMIESKFSRRDFVIELVGEKMIVPQDRSLAKRFVTTIDNLRSHYEYSGN
jgi:hypothetical protein